MVASAWRGAFVILSVWLLGVAVLVVGTYTKSPIGFIWPMGQDLDWSIILKQGVGALAAQQEFAFDHRNPLSGWVYSLAAPLILGHDYGFHLLRLLSSLFLGLSVYALAVRFSRGRSLLFPTILGTIISIWWFWENFTQVVWLMIFALAISVLIVWSFCAYVDSGRTKGAYYGFSLALWLLVLGTYSIQCGAIIPIFFIAWLRGPDRKLGRAIVETIPFGLVAAFFFAIWLAAAGAFFSDPSISKTTGVDISPSQMALSAARFIWHPAFSYLLNAAKIVWSAPVFMLVLLVAAAIVALIVAVIPRKDSVAASREAAGWMVLTMVGLAVPTLGLESTSPVWGPGTRSEMMFFAFVPTVFICLTVLIASLISARAIRFATAAVGTVIASGVILLSLEQIRQGVEATAWQKKLVLPLRPVLASRPRPVHFIVINRSPALLVGVDFGARFAQDKLGHVQPRWTFNFLPNETSMRFIEKTEPPPGFPGAWRVEIGREKVKGALYGLHDEVPRDSVVIVDFDGDTSRVLTDVTPDDLKGMQAEIRP